MVKIIEPPTKGIMVITAVNSTSKIKIHSLLGRNILIKIDKATLYVRIHIHRHD